MPKFTNLRSSVPDMETLQCCGVFADVIVLCSEASEGERLQTLLSTIPHGLYIWRVKFIVLRVGAL